VKQETNFITKLLSSKNSLHTQETKPSRNRLSGTFHCQPLFYSSYSNLIWSQKYSFKIINLTFIVLYSLNIYSLIFILYSEKFFLV
jgi:hypothetical protein